MKQLFARWWRNLTVTTKNDAVDEAETGLDSDLLIPISQLYGFEYYPSVHRYHEK